jgi:spermidine synthase
MKKPIELARALTPDGEVFTLSREAEELVVRVKGVLLMSSRRHGSERAMAEHGVLPIRHRTEARVLVGGLGLGFTLRATLDVLQQDARVVLSELMTALLDWHEGEVGALTAYALRDPRVVLALEDVSLVLQRSGPAFDSILLDVDNSPDALSHKGNAWLYGLAGLQTIHSRLTEGGLLVVWSSAESPAFGRRLTQAGFTSRVVRVHARGEIKKGGRHWLYIGVR